MHCVVSYLPPNGQKLQPTTHHSKLPEIPPGCARVVCIADTHTNERFLDLPWGHILIHAGDILTESGQRHVHSQKENDPSVVKPSGLSLAENFAQWFGSLPHPHKILIAGNHDWVFQSLGKNFVQKMLSENSINGPGKVVYLEHEEATVAHVKVFGSPWGNWGSQNNAYKTDNRNIFGIISDNTHIVVTHSPPILPLDSGKQTETKELTKAMSKAGSLLSVSGHCHWASGLYFPTGGRIPCVVASVCSSDWISADKMSKKAPNASRVDPTDLLHGGYDLFFPIMVCDVEIPGGPPPANSSWKSSSLTSVLADLAKS